MSGSYKCSCGKLNNTEWCVNPNCGIRNTTKYNASRRNDTSSWSSNDFSSYAATNSYSSSSSCDSSSSSDSGSSDGGGCGGSD